MSNNNKKTNKKTVKSAPTLSSSSTTYSLAVKNNSGQDTKVCIYQDTAVAWLVKACGAGGTSEFKWNLDYGAFWKKKTDDSSEDPNFETYPANPRDGSSFILEVTKDEDTLKNVVKLSDSPDGNGASGAIYIDAAGSVGQGVISTGVTLSGSPIDAKNAYPNMNYTFAISHTPIYWLAFGDFTEGEAVNTSEANTALKVEFQTGVYELYFVLQNSQLSEVTESDFNNNEL